MDVRYKSFLEGLVDASKNLTTIEYGATEKVEGIPVDDKFLKLIILTTEIRNAYTGIEVIDSIEYNDLLRSFFDHINTNFDINAISLEEFKQLCSKSSLEDASLLKYLEILHPTLAVGELLGEKRVRFNLSNIDKEWREFTQMYRQVYIDREGV